MEIRVEPEELIVGNRTAEFVMELYFKVEAWVDKEFETLPTRPQDRFHVHQEDIETFHKVIKPYWEGKSLEDVLNQNMEKRSTRLPKL